MNTRVRIWYHRTPYKYFQHPCVVLWALLWKRAGTNLLKTPSPTSKGNFSCSPDPSEEPSAVTMDKQNLIIKTKLSYLQEKNMG